MASGIVAIVVALLTWSYVEGFGRLYPTRQTWRKLRRVRGRRSVRRMRERFEEAAEHRTGRRLAIVLVVLIGVWVASAGLLDKRWYEVVADAGPSAIVTIGLIRIPTALRAVAERMKGYEREVGEDPDKPLDDDLEGGDGEVMAL